MGFSLKLSFKQPSKTKALPKVLFFQHEVLLESLEIMNNHITYFLPIA